MVTRPATPPYSSITMRMCCFSRCISRRSSATFLVSGTKAAGRWICATVRVFRLDVEDFEQVVSEGDAGDVVERAVVDGDAGEGVFVDLGGELAEGEGAGDGEDLGARGHDFEDDLVAELDGGADELAVGLFEDALFFAGFEESVHGFGGMVLDRSASSGSARAAMERRSWSSNGDGEDEVEECLQEGRMRTIQRPRVRAKRSWGMRRSKMRMRRTSSTAARTISPVLGVRASEGIGWSGCRAEGRRVERA